MRNWIRRRLGLTFSLALVLILAVAMVCIGVVLRQRLLRMETAVSQENERSVRTQAAQLLARSVQDQAGHLDALFRSFESQVRTAAAQVAFLLEYADLHAAEAPSREVPTPGPGGWLANDSRALTQALRRAGPISARADIEIAALAHLGPTLDGLQRNDPLCRSAWFAGASGYIRRAPNPGRESLPEADVDLLARPAFRLAAPESDPGRGPRWTSVYEDGLSGEPVVSVAVPAYSVSGAFLGVAGMDLSLAAVGERVFGGPHPPVSLGPAVTRTRFEGEFSLLVTPDGEILAARPSDLVRLGLPGDGRSRLNLGGAENPESRRLAREVRRGVGGSLTLVLGDRNWSAFHHPIAVTGWSLCLFVPEEELQAAVAHSRNVIESAVDELGMPMLLIPLAFMAVASVFVLLFFRMLLLRPIRRLQDGFAALGAGDLDAGVDERLPGELGGLARAFNETVRSLKAEHLAARGAELRYRDIFENAINGFYLTDVQGAAIRVNPAMARMFGYEDARDMEARGRDFAVRHYVDLKDRERLLGLARERGEIRGQEIAYRRLDGSLLWGSVNARAVYDADGRMIRIEGTVEDVTQRKLAERERQALNEQLSAMNEQLSAMNEELSAANEEMSSTNEELVQTNDELVAEMARRRETEERLRGARLAAESASRAKSEFLANMSHEIRTPLNAVMGMLQLLGRSELTGEQAEYADIALVSARSLLSVINDILDLSAVEAGKMVLAAEPFEPAMLLRQVADSFLGQARSKGLRLDWRVDADVPEILVGDPGRLRQVLFNLLGNAVKFTDRGFVRADLSILPVRPGPERVRLLLMVSDSGIGIDPEQAAYIFEPFTQADGSFGRKYQGTGLGLGIVKRIVTLMRGSIAVDSEPGQGATICVTVEVRLPGPEESLARDRRERVRLPGARLNVLVAEDSRINRILVTRVLEKLGHNVTAAEDGRRTLEILAQDRFDLLLLDVQMPGVDGLEVTRAVRAGEAGILDRRIPIIAMTAHAMKGDRETFLEAGMDGYIAKPFELDEFADTLRDVLSKT